MVVGNALTHPLFGFDNNPVLPVETEGQEIWCMPMFHDKVWVWRQTAAKLEALFRPVPVRAVTDTPLTEKSGEIEAESTETPVALPPPAEPEYSVTSTGQLKLF